MTSQIKRRLATLLAAALTAAAGGALAFEVSEAKVNDLLAAKLGESKYRDLGLTATRLTLLEGYARFCADARPRVYPRDLSFCADLTPQWRQESATLSASRMSLVSLDVAGVDPKQTALVKLLLNQGVLPALEGVELYRADAAIARQISAVRVLPGRLDLDLW